MHNDNVEIKMIVSCGFFFNILQLTDLICHTCASRYPLMIWTFWIPASAGMTMCSNFL